MKKRGFRRLMVDSQMFINDETGVIFHVHVDDPWAIGPRKELRKILADLSTVMLLRYTDVVKVGEKIKHLGDEYERTTKGWIQRPSPGYVEDTLRMADMGNCNASPTQGSEAITHISGSFGQKLDP